MQKTKKGLSFFCFHKSVTINLSKKPKKKLEFFFSRSWPKKTKKTRGKPKKKQTWTSDQTLSEKFWFFCFLVFSRFFWFWFRGLWWVRLLIFSSGFWFGSLWWVHGYLGNTFEKQFPLAGFGIHYFPKKTAFPKIIPAIYFKPLSSKTGLFKGK